MKKAFALVLVSVFFLASLAYSAEYWASKNSNKYHYPNCRYAQKIKPSNLVKFNSPEQAIKAGYVPCKVCKPPISSKVEDNETRHIHVANTQMERRGGQ
jgi:methylphosphotriester-DNA--protein-cysteine methyltransferase